METGTLNTFHSKVAIHTARNRLSLSNEKSAKTADYEQVKQMAVEFYKILFSDSKKLTSTKPTRRHH